MRYVALLMVLAGCSNCPLGPCMTHEQVQDILDVCKTQVCGGGGPVSVLPEGNIMPVYPIIPVPPNPQTIIILQ